jgi:hypothetical protein
VVDLGVVVVAVRVVVLSRRQQVAAAPDHVLTPQN